MNMDLTRLDDAPELAVEVGGRAYRFGEFPVAKLVELQAYLREAVPHPIDAIKPHLAGLEPEERKAMLDAARAAAADWPPQVGSKAAYDVLMSAELHQIRVLALALSVHQPETTPDDARRLYRTLSRRMLEDPAEAGRDGTVRRIFSVIFGMGDPSLQPEGPVPEAPAPDRDGSTGGGSTGSANDGSGCANGRSAAIPSRSS